MPVLANMKPMRAISKPEEHFRQAIASDSNYATLIIGMAVSLLPWRMDEGLKELRTALELIRSRRLSMRPFLPGISPQAIMTSCDRGPK